MIVPSGTPCYNCGMTRQDVFDYVAREYGDEPRYPWMKYPSYAVIRRGKKWYAALLDIDKGRLGLDGKGVVDLLNVKCPPLLCEILTRSGKALPAYHMNKSHWVSIVLDGGKMTDVEIFDMIDQSRGLVK